MTDSWSPRNDELALIAGTVPLLASLAVVYRPGVQVAAEWAIEAGPTLEVAEMAALLPAALSAIAPGAEDASVTVSTRTQTVVVVELWADWIVVFGFREAVSFDWSSYYVRRALGMMRHH